MRSAQQNRRSSPLAHPRGLVPKRRVHNLSMSLDGLVAGPDQDLDNSFGVGGIRLHDWVFATATGRRMLGMPDEGLIEGTDDAFIAAGDDGIGATIIGRNLFGPIRGDWADESWTGWWHAEAPFECRTPTRTHPRKL